MQRKIRWIIVLLTPALLGIIGFQVWWLVDTFQVHQDQLEKEVNAALEKALEKDLLMYTLGEKQTYLKQQANEFQSIRQQVGFNQHANDSLILTTTRQQIQMYTYSGDSLSSAEIRAQSPDLSAGRMVETKTEPKANIPDSSGYRYSYSYNTNPGQAAKQSNDAIIHQKISGFVSNMMSAFWDFKPDLPRLDHQYRRELSRRGLPAEYGFALVDHRGRILEALRPEMIEDESLRSEKTPYLINEHAYLQAYFPNSTPFIIQKMSLSLVFSLLLIGLTVGGFLYMLITIFRQKRLSEIRNDFINNMTHELKTPIATVSAAVEAMQHFGALDNKERASTYLDISQKELNRLAGMVQKILNIAAYEKQDFELKREQVNLVELIQNTGERVKMGADKEANFDLDLQFLDERVKVDRVHFSNVLSNLFDNAIKYSDSPAQVKVLGREEGGHYEIAVADKGKGISKSHQKLVFDKFYRVPTGNLHTVRGFGLGLHYVKKVVERHEGTVTLESEPGQGSTFTIRIPR